MVDLLSMRRIGCTAIFAATFLFSSEDNDLSIFKKSNSEITQITLFGERCSGTYFFERLLKENLKKVHMRSSFGYKHYPAWIGYPGKKNVQHALKGASNTLFIFIFRDPYEWVRSFSVHRWGLENAESDFYTFLRCPSEPKKSHESYFRQMDPDTGRPFDHPMALRNKKNKNYLMMARCVQNCYLVRYEDLARAPERVLQDIASFYEIKQKQKFVHVNEHLQGGMPVTKTRIKPTLNREDISFINATLDWEIESLLGYKKRELTESKDPHMVSFQTNKD